MSEFEDELRDVFEAELVEVELQADVQVIALCNELGIGGALQDEMLRDSARARAVLRHAKDAPRIRNRAAFAIANWRARSFEPRALARVLPAEEAPALSTLELLWSLEETPVTRALERMMTAAIERNGGARALMLAAGLKPLPPQGELDLKP